MKKLLTLTIIALIALIGLSVSVNAASVSTEADLKSAVLTDGTVTLSADIELTSSLEVGKKVTINLNGHDITAADGMTDDSLIIVLHGGTLTVEGNNGSISATNSNASARVAVKMTKGGNTLDFVNNNPAKLILNSGILEGTSFGISGNGNPDRVNTSITINGGTVKGDSTGIYHPQEGELIVNGGTVKGSTGIEMRSGVLEVNDGTIIGTGSPSSVTANGNGTTTVGAGIAIAQHTTEKNISVVVDGGKIQGYSAIYESNPQSNTTMEKVSIEINDGEFEAINGGTVAIYSEDKSNFINGGTFSSEIEADYISGNLEAVEDEDGNVYVGTLHDIIVKDSENGKVEANKKEAVKGQPVTLNVEPNEGYKLKSLTVMTVEDDEVEVKDGKFVMPNMEVEVSAEFEKIPEEVKEEPKEEKDETPKTGSIDVVLVASAIVAVISIAGIVLVKKYTR